MFCDEKGFLNYPLFIPIPYTFFTQVFHKIIIFHRNIFLSQKNHLFITQNTEQYFYKYPLKLIKYF